MTVAEERPDALVGYTGVHVHVVATALANAAPGVPAAQRGSVTRYILDCLADLEMVCRAGLPTDYDEAVRARDFLLRNKPLAAFLIEQERDAALEVVRLAEAWHDALVEPPPPDRNAVIDELAAKAALIEGIERWRELNAPAEEAVLDVPGPRKD